MESSECESGIRAFFVFVGMGCGNRRGKRAFRGSVGLPSLCRASSSVSRLSVLCPSVVPTFQGHLQCHPRILVAASCDGTVSSGRLATWPGSPRHLRRAGAGTWAPAVGAPEARPKEASGMRACCGPGEDVGPAGQSGISPGREMHGGGFLCCAVSGMSSCVNSAPAGAGDGGNLGRCRR